MPLDKTRGMIVDPSTGAPFQVPTIQLSADEARLLRQYKKLLASNGLREAVFCNNCWEGNISDGCDAIVTDTQIIIKCRCTLRVYMGPTY